jgi:hypothetical protein
MITVFPVTGQNKHKNKKILALVKKIKFEINSLKTKKFRMDKKHNIGGKI